MAATSAPDGAATAAPSARWITWAPRGSDPYTNPRSTVAHAAPAGKGSLTNGSFPLACGRWAPDGWDAEIIVVAGYAPRCRRCELAIAQRNV